MRALPELDAIVTEWESDCGVDSSDLAETTVRFARIHAKYLSYYSSARLRLRKKEAELADLKKFKWLYYTGKMTKEEMDSRGWPYDPFSGCSKPLRGDMDYFFDSDKDLSALISIIEYTKVTVDALKEILDTIRWRHAAVKNALDSKKFDAGV